MLPEFAVIVLLVLTNGLLAGGEIAVVTASRGRMTERARAGSAAAAAVLRLKEQPERFLATVQVGITAIGSLAGAFGGATFAPLFARLYAAVPLLRPAAYELGFVTVVAVLTYLSVVLGELVPKSLALRHAEGFAVAVARPVGWLGTLARPVVWLLARSSNLVLRPFHDRTDFLEGRLSREDLAGMLREASQEGAVQAETGRLLRRALEFEELRVGDVMVPRRSIVALPRDTDADGLRETLRQHAHRRIAVYGDDIDDIVGYVLRDDVLSEVLEGRQPRVDALLRPPLFLPEQSLAQRALIDLQRRKSPLAFVVEELGGIAGLVTIEDLVEELTGEIFSERDAPTHELREQPDGGWLGSGLVEIRAANRDLGLELEEPPDIRTLSGLCVWLADGRLPHTGECFTAADGTVMEVVDASPRRVRTVRLRPAPRTGQPAS